VGDATGARDVDPAARRDASGSLEPMLVRRKNRPQTKMGLAPSVTKTDSGHYDEDDSSTGEEDRWQRRAEAEERVAGVAR
jgi:hypothetical protein